MCALDMLLIKATYLLTYLQEKAKCAYIRTPTYALHRAFRCNANICKHSWRPYTTKPVTL